MTIQRLIDDTAERGGGIIQLENRLYLTDPLTLYTGVQLVGQGKSTVLRLKSGANASVIKTFKSPDGKTIGNAQQCAVRNLTIDGNKAMQSGISHGIEVSCNPLNVEAKPGDLEFDSLHFFENLYIKDVLTDGFNAEGRSQMKLHNVTVYRADRHSFKPSFDTDMTACISGESGYAGFNLNHSSIRLSACKSFYSGRVVKNYEGWGFLINATSGVVLSACEAQDNQGHGFEISDCQGIVIQGVADSNSRAGHGSYSALDLWNSKNCIIQLACYDRNEFNAGAWQVNALRLHGATGNTLILSHFGLNGAVKGSLLSSDSEPITGNFIQANAAVQT